MGLIATAIADSSSGVALNDTCVVVVPAAPGLAITLDVKDALRSRVAERVDQAASAVAAIALRWLAHLAVLTDEARPALADALTGVARSAAEPMPFAVAAAQVAGLTYDCWRDGIAVDCLTRLVDTDGDADAWFALGQSRLVDALEADDRDTCISGLRSTLECFDNAANNGEQRPDARMYGHAIRFVTGWVADATARDARGSSNRGAYRPPGVHARRNWPARPTDVDPSPPRGGDGVDRACPTHARRNQLSA